MLPKKGKVFPNRDGQSHSEIDYATAIAAALREDLGGTHRATKTVMRWTGASERAVKNWFAARSGPSGEHLVALTRHSDAVFGAFMRLAGRDQALAAKKLIDARDALVKMLELIVNLTDGAR
jgi:hypothetical protein